MSNKIVIVLVLALFYTSNLSSQEKSSCCSNDVSKNKSTCMTMSHSDHQENEHNMVMKTSSMDSTKKSTIKHKHEMHNQMDIEKESQMKKSEKVEKEDPETWVRKGVIDLKSIDKNGDGKVYQDQMCWNVISDVPGNCPFCEMKLKEVSIDKAKENLIKHGFKVK